MLLRRRIMKENKATLLKAKGEVWHRARAKGSLHSWPGAHGEAGGGQGALTPLKPPESLSHLNILQALSWKQRPESSPVLLNMNKACSPSIIEQPGGTRRRRLPARVLPCCSRGQRPEVANAPRNSASAAFRRPDFPPLLSKHAAAPASCCSLIIHRCRHGSHLFSMTLQAW